MQRRQFLKALMASPALLALKPEVKEAEEVVKLVQEPNESFSTYIREDDFLPQPQVTWRVYTHEGEILGSGGSGGSGLLTRPRMHRRMP